ncbi:tRNA (adenosine(37)-N6)-threonylcarbamoyltransferase complex dimerization subunit type 1 TsaB [Ramlibacter sp.]|uniref:tRNA (adenosine(37)-N6)-threonylcarbamoyltransferase complex dimerization subunit type 1 TsaB n=1 Tax=Ramlibacter sp. TaxID=1917967 RepID=UPI002C870C6E|nr:tRNA (adenosine(37)-N6)-threonylcarbamoyltransferase complex dimerization subunit type 1 TsaB [Ramlibacter sp.]HWI82802.1 tRNA (adenosine(37)-N6)-threonylcarbamoyltransferase complex dimerization subunit type 1 TsaB [Ramlibacter sp.]
MNLLALDTSTEVFSIAVQRGGAAPLQQQGPGGANASAALIPAIQDLLARSGLALAGLDAIVFGRGPGSFTGLRTACAVAQGLAFGADLPVLAVDTLLAVAEQARGSSGVTRVVAMLDARMDEVYAAAYEWSGAAWQERQGVAVQAPQRVQVPAGWAMAGNVFAPYGERLPGGVRVEALPSAAALLRLAPALLAAGRAGPAAAAIPLYIRDKVAQTTEERAAARALTSPSP